MSKYYDLPASILGCIFLFSAVACKSPASETRNLKFNLQKGKTYIYELIYDMDQEVMGGKNKFGFMTGFTVHVTDDDGKLKTLDAGYKDFKMNMKITGQEINIDATKKSEPVDSGAIEKNPLALLSNAFSGILGKKITMKVDSDGNMQDITGFDKIIRGMTDSMRVNDEMKLMIEASLKDQFNDDKVKEMFAPMFSIFPGKEIKIGDSWEKSYELTGKNPVKYTTQYTVKAFEGNNVILDAKSKIEPSGEFKISGTQTGVLTVNSKSGLVIDAELSQNLETSGDLKMKMIGKAKMKGREGGQE